MFHTAVSDKAARRAIGSAVLAGALVLALASPAFAPHVAQLQVTPAVVAPGQDVTVYGPRGYGSANAVSVRFDSVSGPVLGTFTPNNERFAQFGPGTVTIPADAPPGPHYLVATQDLAADEQHIRGVPSVAQIEVVPSAPAGTGQSLTPLRTESRPGGLKDDAGAPLGLLIAAAVGTGALALGLGFAVAGAARRRSTVAEGSRPEARS